MPDEPTRTWEYHVDKTGIGPRAGVDGWEAPHTRHLGRH
jgi:hypothetical protein